MKRITKTLALSALAASVLAVSCKKKDSTSSPIVGKWKIVQGAIDVNNDGVMQSSEVVTDSTNTTTTFNSNGTGVIATSILGTNVNFNFSWALQNSNTWLKVTNQDSIQTTTYSHVDTLTSSRMVLKDTTDAKTQWTIFVKQ